MGADLIFLSFILSLGDGFLLTEIILFHNIKVPYFFGYKMEFFPSKTILKI